MPRNAMSPADNVTRIVNGKRYSVATATLIASNSYWDGSNWDRGGRNTFLYRTPKGAYFQVHLTMWQGEQDTLIPCSEAEARQAYEEWLPEHYVEYEEAFPNTKVEEA